MVYTGMPTSRADYFYARGNCINGAQLSGSLSPPPVGGNTRTMRVAGCFLFAFQ